MPLLKDPVKIAKKFTKLFVDNFDGRCKLIKDNPDEFRSLCRTLYDPLYPFDGFYIDRSEDSHREDFTYFFVGHDISLDGDVWEDFSFVCPDYICEVNNYGRQFKKGKENLIWNVNVVGKKGDKMTMEFFTVPIFKK